MAVDGVRLSPSSGYNGSATTLQILDIARFNVPWLLLVVFLVAFVANSILTAESTEEATEPTLTGPGGKPLPRSARKIREARKKKEKEIKEFSPSRRSLFVWLCSGVLATYCGNDINIVAHALDQRQDGWWCGEASAIYYFASSCFYILILISLVDAKPSPSIAHEITWVVALVGDLVIFGALTLLYISPPTALSAIARDSKFSEQWVAPWDLIELTLNGIRLLLLASLVSFYFIFTLERSFRQCDEAQLSGKAFDERSALLNHGKVNSNDSAAENGYATTNVNTKYGRKDQTKCDGAEEDVPAFYKPTTPASKTWWEYLRGYSLFFPYLWPSRSLRLQLVAAVCFILVVAQRGVNIAAPIQLGIVTNKLYAGGGIPWLSILLLILYKFMHGASGILGALRTVLWIPIGQNSARALTTASFEHVHGLSLDFHISKRTGEVISALNKGNAINSFLDQVTFSVIPMIFDLGIAIGYFAYAFDAYYALVVSIITFAYLYLTIRMASWRADTRRQMQNLTREMEAVKNDSLMSYETVKYFGAEEYEFSRYRQAVVAFQTTELRVNISLNILNISQNLVFILGLLIVSLIAAYQVTIGKREVGDFVTLISYMNQLQAPLNFFASFYRSVQSSMIGGERLLELFKEKPTVVDEFGARLLPSCEGEIRFQNVKFSYDKRKPALQDLTFTCNPGTTTAVVGESGGGKSTIFRLLYRFYNIDNGSIQIDGNDIKDVTIQSLRTHVGVVPQDTILFNETVMYNLRYANQGATDEDIYEACRAASIHDKIMAFPDGYNTKVGERGLRLSGGEKQRVAIARTIIKNPRIIMLDEATAALDSKTEQHIQEAFNRLSAGRTMLIIAHRLSTITNADQILVLHAGKVVESGTHQDLLALKGRYASMWKNQIKAERRAASEMVAQANALKLAALERLGSSASIYGGPSEDVSENEVDLKNSNSSKTVPKLLLKTNVYSSRSYTDPGSSPAPTVNYDSYDEPRSDDSKSDDDSCDSRSLEAKLGSDRFRAEADGSGDSTDDRDGSRPAKTA